MRKQVRIVVHNKIIGKVGIFALLFNLICFFIMPINAEADERGSLTVDSSSAKIQVVDMHWRVYRVADVIDSGTVKLCGEFADFPVKFDIRNDSLIKSAAYSLEAYAVAQNIQPLYSKIASSKETATFDSLEEGCYLVLGEPVKKDLGLFLSVPTLVCIADGQKYDCDWDLNMTIIPKIGLVSSGNENNTADRTVKKVWEYAKNTPDITVKLFQDGELYDTVVLNEENNWEFTWDELPNIYRWTVIEDSVPDNCYVSYTQSAVKSGNVTAELFVITNTYDENFPPKVTTSVPQSTTTDVSSVTTSQVTTVKGGSSTSATGSRVSSNGSGLTSSGQITYTTVKNSITTTVSSKDKLPQTGQLWWPVPVLGFAGLVLFSFGWYINKENKK